MIYDLERILKKLVEMPTVTADSMANSAAIDYVSEFMQEAGMNIHRQQFGASDTLIATSQDTKSPRVMLYGHLDVVDADADHFQLENTGERLVGRGTIDMKFAIASYLHLTHKFKAILQDLDYGIMIVCDEEKGGLSAQKLLDMGFSADVAVLPDGGLDWAIEKASKGAHTIMVEAHGKGAHGSRPWLGESASLQLLDFLIDVKTLFVNQGKETDTLNISQLTTTELLSNKVSKSENPQNRVPHFASATLDIRVVSKASLALLKKKLTDLADKHVVKYKIIADFPASEHDVNHPLIKTFVDLVEEATSKQHAPVISSGSNDSSYFEAKGIPSIVICPPGGGAHSDNEWIEKRGFIQFTEIVGKYLLQVGRTKG